MNKTLTYPATITVESIKITPDLAKLWLENCNINNRPIRKNQVTQLANAIRTGAWSQTPDLIAFDIDGVLMNGQHRLAAIIEADTTVDALVGRGFADDAYYTTDAGKSRNFGDHYHRRGIPNASHAAGIVNGVQTWEKAGYSAAAMNRVARGGLSAGPRSTQLIESLDRYSLDPEGFQKAHNDATRVARRFKMPSRMFGVVFYRINQIDEEDAGVFIESLVSGELCGASNATLKLREALLKNALASKKLDRVVELAIIIKAWNAYRQGVDINQLGYRAGGAKPEAFPHLDGDPLDAS